MSPHTHYVRHHLMARHDTRRSYDTLIIYVKLGLLKVSTHDLWGLSVEIEQGQLTA